MLNNYLSELAERGETYIRIKVRPGAAKSAIREIMADETVKIDIAAPPEKGRANQALIGFLAGELHADKNKIKIISGQTDKIKLIKIVK